MARVRVGSIVLRVDNLQRQTAFWAAALDYVPREGDSDDFVLLRPATVSVPTCPSANTTPRSRCRHAFISTYTPRTRPQKSNACSR